MSTLFLNFNILAQNMPFDENIRCSIGLYLEQYGG